MQTRHDCNAITTLVGCTGCITGRNTANAKSDAWSTNLNKCLCRGSWGVFPNVSEYFLQHGPRLHFTFCVSGLKGPQQPQPPAVGLSSADPEQGDFKGLERKKLAFLSKKDDQSFNW